MEEFLSKKIKNMEGSLLGIGITSDKIKNAIEKNDKITICNLLEEIPTGISKKKLSVKNKPRKVNIKKIKKTFRKKRVNNIICNLDIIEPFQKTFVRDSIYINKENIYIYGNKEKLQEIKTKYERYTNDIKIDNQNKQSILIINSKNAKQNKFKDIYFWWVDTLTKFIDILTAILAN